MWLQITTLVTTESFQSFQSFLFVCTFLVVSSDCWFTIKTTLNKSILDNSNHCVLTNYDNEIVLHNSLNHWPFHKLIKTNKTNKTIISQITWLTRVSACLCRILHQQKKTWVHQSLFARHEPVTQSKTMTPTHTIIMTRYLKHRKNHRKFIFSSKWRSYT